MTRGLLSTTTSPQRGQSIMSFLLLLSLLIVSQQQAVHAQEEASASVSVQIDPISDASYTSTTTMSSGAGFDLYPPPIGSILDDGDGENSSNGMISSRSSLQDYFQSGPSITLRTAVVTNSIPLAWREEGGGDNDEHEKEAVLKGFQIDLLHRLEELAMEDNVTLKFDMEEAPPDKTYNRGPARMANDCNTTGNPIPWEECYTHDLWVGDFYGLRERVSRGTYTPALLETAASSMRNLHRDKSLRVYTSLEEAEASYEPVCVLDFSYFDTLVVQKYPKANFIKCYSHEECIVLLKQDNCCLFVDDELQLRHLSRRDTENSVEMTPWRFNVLRIVWPYSAKLDPRISTLLTRWIYAAQEKGDLTELYDKYFSIAYCPLGWSGPNCTLPCSATHGTSNREGVCVCDSTKWTGNDCLTEVQEDLQLIPRPLLLVGYTLMAINTAAVLFCATWLWFHRTTPQVKIGQPVFLCMVLLGCLISSSVIIALGQQDSDFCGGDDDGKYSGIACMAVPWLYSVGFCITFGTLFAKIRRVCLIFRAAANMRRLTVSIRETVSVVATVLFVDVIILTIWTVFDPLYWQRTKLTMDKYGQSLSSEGHCTSQHWGGFALTIGLFHFSLMCTACIMCFVSRNIPTRFSEGNYVSVAMVSNLQIFVVGIPLLILLGTDPITSYFVRVVIVWMNDLVVLGLIFGNLMYSVHIKDAAETRSSRTLIGTAIKEFAENSRKGSQRNERSVTSGSEYAVEQGTHNGSMSHEQEHPQAKHMSFTGGGRRKNNQGNFLETYDS